MLQSTYVWTGLPRQKDTNRGDANSPRMSRHTGGGTMNNDIQRSPGAVAPGPPCKFQAWQELFHTPIGGPSHNRIAWAAAAQRLNDWELMRLASFLTEAASKEAHRTKNHKSKCERHKQLVARHDIATAIRNSRRNEH